MTPGKLHKRAEPLQGLRPPDSAQCPHDHREFACGDTKDEPEDLVVDFLRQSLLGLAHAGVFRHRVGGREAEELTDRASIGAPPGDQAVRPETLEVDHEQHAEEDTRRNARLLVFYWNGLCGLRTITNFIDEQPIPGPVLF